MAGSDDNDVVVPIHSSGFTGDEADVPSTWTLSRLRDRLLQSPTELAGVCPRSRLGTRAVDWTAMFGLHGLVSLTAGGGVCEPSSHGNLTPLAARLTSRWRGPRDAGPDRVAGAVLARPSSRGAVESSALWAAGESFRWRARSHVSPRVLHRHRGAQAPARQRLSIFGAHRNFVDLDKGSWKTASAGDLVFDVIAATSGSGPVGRFVPEERGDCVTWPDRGAALWRPDYRLRRRTHRAQLSEVVPAGGRYGHCGQIGNVACPRHAVAAFNPTESTQGKYDHPRSSVRSRSFFVG